jgi:hypothetical protein
LNSGFVSGACLSAVREGKVVFASVTLIDGELHKLNYALKEIKGGIDAKGGKFRCLFRTNSRLYDCGISASYWLGY